MSIFKKVPEFNKFRKETYVKTISNANICLFDDELEYLIADGYELLGSIRTVTEWEVNFSENEKRFDVIHYATLKKVIYG